jgi:uncharacterized protein YbbC (DUF1343 family)
MKRYLTHRNLVSILLLFVMLVGAQSQVKTGFVVLAENVFDLLQGKRFGLVSNPTGVD